MELDIKKIRKDAGLNQIEFASIFGVHYQTVSRWENGTKFPTEHQKVLLQITAKKLRRFKNSHQFLITQGATRFLSAIL